MPIVADITNDLLSLSGIEDITDGPLNLEYRIISDINRGLNAVADQNPSVYYQKRPDQAEYIHAPVTLNVGVTQGSKAITISVGYVPSWMAGCAILISGDSNLNRLENEAAGSAPTLDQPYLGPTGTVSAQVFHDWIRLPANVDSVMDPITAMQRRLVRAMSLELLNCRYLPPGAVRDYQSFPLFPFAWQKQENDPWQWFEVSRVYQGDWVSGLMLDALPPATDKLGYTARIGFTRVTSLSDIRVSLIPQNKDQEILLPVVRWFYASHMSVSIPKSELQAEYELALQSAASFDAANRRRTKFIYTSQR